ncbi:sigma-54-dependent transcriptional regulator [Ningiella sp. W23]|uniref:sigma-54-dependent transcriptional regulator n=1 Tax=Ningiella sp. W23 TaxID=3023715 RepID=UPI00375695A0
MSYSIIVADDDTNVLSALKLLLELNEFEVSCVTTPEALIEQIKQRTFSLALLDLNYHADTTSGQEGLALIEQVSKLHNELPIVVMTGYSSVEIAVSAMQMGASDFIEKPWNNERLLSVVNNQIEKASLFARGNKLQAENDLLRDAHQSLKGQAQFIAQSGPMQLLLEQLNKLAKSDMSILFTGENGTGKSALAEYLHIQSSRADAPFVPVNMGAISSTLFESEMFGHVKGAFTDAKQNRIGRFELAECGTIFLDEIATIDLAQQAKLLRVLESRQFEKVGSSRTQSMNVRLVSATNANIQEMVKNGNFRQDLLYRLNTIVLEIPPLRYRKADIPMLSAAFIKEYASKYQMPEKRLSDKSMSVLTAYAWPGNIRELRHIIERAFFLANDDIIEPQSLGIIDGDVPGDNDKGEGFPIDWQQASLEDIEKAVISDRLLRFEQNPAQISDSLGLSRSAYYRRLEKYTLG